MALALTLRIENETKLPDGGPLTVSVSGRRGLDIGRDQHLDWTLPDPSRFISGKHCEVRYQDGGYWLHDVSTNGTFLYGKDTRLKEPYRLRNGDRLVIGQYIVAVSIEGEIEDGAKASPVSQPLNHDNLWSTTDDAAPPIDPRHLRAPRDVAPVRPDFLDWAVDLPNADTPSALEPPRAPDAARIRPYEATDGMGWAHRTPDPPPPEPEFSPLPTPRRPPQEVADFDRPRRGARPEAMQAAHEAEAYAEFVRQLARGAGIPSDVFANQSPAELGESLGALIRVVVDNTRQLLDARQHAKRIARSTNQTIIQAHDNNPLKFSPTAEEALRIMFGPRTKGYLDARRSIEQSFGDLKSHQLKTFSAMQHAVRLLVADLDPQAIAKDKRMSGLGALFRSRKARLWDVYIGRWRDRTKRHQDGLVDAFMTHFAECYDRETNGLK